MTVLIKQTQEDIDDVLNRAYERIDEGGSQWRGMTYEEGIARAIEWILGRGDHPLEES